MKSDSELFKIEISFRGESIIYRADGREWHFDIYCDTPIKLYADTYWDGLRRVKLSQSSDFERSVIIPRLVEYLGLKGETVEVDYASRSPYKPPEHLIGRAAANSIKRRQ
jgi:hypothetical protein